MSERVIVTIYLPLEMGAVAKIMATVARAFPDAVIEENRDDTGVVRFRADDDSRLTKAQRRRMAKERRAR